MDDSNKLLPSKNLVGFFENDEFSRKMRMILESSHDGIYITDGSANTLLLNRAYEQITGLLRSDLLGHNMIEMEDQGVVSQSASLIVLESKQTTTIEQSFATGKRALVTSTPIFDENGDIELVVTNVRDITYLVRIQDQLARKEALARKYQEEAEVMRLLVLGNSEIIASDEKMIEMLRIAKRIAQFDTTVLISGETGVGKEEVAKYIHKNSTRSEKPFIKVNCGAIPENLIESELFGYEPGAFTGASKEGKLGLFEVASEGTLFLDEVGELPLEMQVRLLRVLQERELVRIGGVRPIKVNVRILAATNRNLDAMVRQKLFREDLYYRLNVVPIHILPLRDRKEDILPLIKFFLDELNTKYGWDRSLSGEAMKMLFDYHWPGNVRELKNILERVAVMCESERIGQSDLELIIGGSHNARMKADADSIMTLKEATEQLEREMIEKAVTRYGNVRAAARVLGVDSSTLVRKRQRYR